MKPRIELSDKGNPTIWESGSWQKPQGIGRGCLIAGPEGEKLQVIFDKNPQTANFQYLFFANPNQVIATAFVKDVPPNQIKYDLTLSRIKALTSDIVQGESVLKAELETLWTLKQIVPKTTQVHQLVEASYLPSRIGYKNVYKEIMLAAVEKAMTPSAHQKLFWGTPRNADR
jgi:hypothetical protein